MTQPTNNLLKRQFSLKQFLIFITVCCVLVYWALLSWRRMKYQELSEMHRMKSITSYSLNVGVYGLDKAKIKSFNQQQERYLDYHRSMAKKYSRAAKYPWMTVEEDPPEPPDPLVTEFGIKR